MDKKRFNVEGMTCAACALNVDKAVRHVKGVKDVNVNLLTNTMDVEFESCSIDEINKAVDKAGYKSYLPFEKKTNDFTINDTKNIFIRLILSILFLIPLVIISMGYMLHKFEGLMNYPLFVGLIEMLISVIILFLNKKYFISGFKSLKKMSLNMDSLVSLGSGVAFIYSLILLMIMAFNQYNIELNQKLSMNLYFETAGMVPTLISIGKTLESISKSKTTNALKSLINLAPKKAHVIRNNKEIEVDVSDVLIDDIFIVRQGESIPVDGIIIKGNTSIDESMLSGESIPLDKKIDDNIYQGTINMYGVIEARATKIGKDTSLSQIIKLVEEASSSKAKIGRFVDKVSAVFIPFVLLVSLLVFVLWLIIGLNNINYNSVESPLSYAISRAISVLVISCPCALGLATPVAIMVASGTGARNGILFKNAEVLETTGKAKFIVFDKTGTITYGKPSIKSILPINISKELLLKYAVSLEIKSNHPLAKAICENYDKELFDVDNFNAIVGVGVEGYINNSHIIGVNSSYAYENNLIDDEIQNKINSLSVKGETPMVFILDNKVIGIISVLDLPKEEAKVAIRKLNNLGFTPLLLTGDNSITAKAIANMCEIKNVVSDVKPDQKQSIIKKLKKYGDVIMVGDGINDAIALTEASVGMAIGTGTDVAIDAADVVLIKSNLIDVYKAIRLSQATLKNIKENLFWAFIYNIIMIPIAAGALAFIGLSMKPWYGALAMSVSSITVVLNALRLNITNLTKDKFKKKANIDVLNILKEDDTSTLIFKVDGMMCEHCIKHVEEACLSIKNINYAKASLEEGNVIIKCNGNIDENQIIENIKQAGYTARKE